MQYLIEDFNYTNFSKILLFHPLLEEENVFARVKIILLNLFIMIFIILQNCFIIFFIFYFFFFYLFFFYLFFFYFFFIYLVILL